jgi:hypothetical protein
MMSAWPFVISEMLRVLAVLALALGALLVAPLEAWGFSPVVSPVELLASEGTPPGDVPATPVEDEAPAPAPEDSRDTTNFEDDSDDRHALLGTGIVLVEMTSVQRWSGYPAGLYPRNPSHRQYRPPRS